MNANSYTVTDRMPIDMQSFRRLHREWDITRWDFFCKSTRQTAARDDVDPWRQAIREHLSSANCALKLVATATSFEESGRPYHKKEVQIDHLRTNRPTFHLMKNR